MAEEGTGQITVLVVEDEELFRDLLQRALSSEPNIRVVGTAADGPTAIRLAQELEPNVVLMDIELEGEMHGLQAGVAIKQQRPETNIVVLSAHKDTQFLSTIPMGEAEGWSYLMKQSVSGAGTLMRVIEGSASGLTVLDSEIVRDLTPRGDSSLARLTRRQLDVLELMAQGYNNAAIAERLSIGLTSVENYINSLYRELNLTEEPGIHARVRATLLYAEEARAVG